MRFERSSVLPCHIKFVSPTFAAVFAAAKDARCCARAAGPTDVRTQSGAQVEVERNGDECRVRLAGTQEQVDLARSLVNALAEAAAEGPPAVAPPAAAAEGNAEDGTSDTLEFPIAVTGGIIGSRGAKIAEVRSKSGAQVSIEKTEEKCKVILTGTPEQIERARVLVQELAAEARPGVRRTENEQVVQVPQSMIGKVIGRGGETIKRLQRETGAKIDVISDGSDPCPVRVTGAAGAVAAAQYMINELCGQGRPSNPAIMQPAFAPASEAREIDMDEL